LYETWIEKSTSDFGNVVLVAEKKDNIVGYITCESDNISDTGRIGLVAVKPDARGLNVGTELVNSALNWFCNKGFNKVFVTTQGGNITSQRLYQKCGFRTHSIMIWYHRWFHVDI